MWKRLTAAAIALVLAATGILLVVRYANSADERAMEGMETEEILVALEDIPEGTLADELGERVGLRPVPRDLIVDGALDDMSGMDGEVLTAGLSAGEQVLDVRFMTPDERRASGRVDLPEEAADLHQVTVSLEKPRALGGDVTAGDTVGVFMSFDVTEQEGFTLTPSGEVVRDAANPDALEDGEGESSPGGASISMTHLALHKVLVARVEGGYVAPPASAESGDEGQPAQDTINVTLALSASQAEQLVFAMEFGTVWLSLEPESASEDGTGPVVVTVPNQARDVYQ